MSDVLCLIFNFSTDPKKVIRRHVSLAKKLCKEMADDIAGVESLRGLVSLKNPAAMPALEEQLAYKHQELARNRTVLVQYPHGVLAMVPHMNARWDEMAIYESGQSGKSPVAVILFMKEVGRSALAMAFVAGGEGITNGQRMVGEPQEAEAVPEFAAVEKMFAFTLPAAELAAQWMASTPVQLAELMGKALGMDTAALLAGTEPSGCTLAESGDGWAVYRHDAQSEVAAPMGHAEEPVVSSREAALHIPTRDTQGALALLIEQGMGEDTVAVVGDGVLSLYGQHIGAESVERLAQLYSKVVSPVIGVLLYDDNNFVLVAASCGKIASRGFYWFDEEDIEPLNPADFLRVTGLKADLFAFSAIFKHKSGDAMAQAFEAATGLPVGDIERFPLRFSETRSGVHIFRHDV